jgi:RimJ/RimL family protein N-acetyltransferase
MKLMVELDADSKFMMLEPGERQTSAQEQDLAIEEFLSSASKVMFVAEDEGALVGFVAGYGYRPNRKKHVMNCVLGVLSRASGKGLGTRLMKRLEDWACGHRFARMELTVMAHNERAQRLYSRCGFEVEGIKRHSICVDGKPVDERLMAKLLTAEALDAPTP